MLVPPREADPAAARRVVVLPCTRCSTFSHALGTVRMGADPASAPLDGWCRYRGLDNLLVVDAQRVADVRCGEPEPHDRRRGAQGGRSPGHRSTRHERRAAAVTDATVLPGLRPDRRRSQPDAPAPSAGCHLLVSRAARSTGRGRSRPRHGGAQAFGSYAEAIASPDVDVVAVVTPPASHLEWTLAALDGGQGRHPREAARAPRVRLRRDRAGVRGTGPARLRRGELLLQADSCGGARRAPGRRRRRSALHPPECREAAADRRTGATIPARPAAARSSRAGFTGSTSPAPSASPSARSRPLVPGPAAGLERSMALLIEYAGGPGRPAVVLVGGRVAAQGTSRLADLRPRREPRVRVERPVSRHLRPAVAHPVPRSRRYARLPGDVLGLPAGVADSNRTAHDPRAGEAGRRGDRGSLSVGRRRIG